MSAMFSLYIPSVKASYSVEKIMFLFWRLGFGKVDRVDFVPIIKSDTTEECLKFKQAFIYVDARSEWHPDIVKSIEEGAPYKVYPNREESFHHLRDEKEYWLILKNKSPVPYATTTLNVHQLANNLALLEKQFAEKEAELAEKEAELAEKEAELAHQKALISELEAVNTRLSEFNRDRSVDDENTEEMKAYNFVTSFDNVLRMMDHSDNEDDYDERDGHYAEYIRDMSKSTRVEPDKMTEGMESKSFIIIEPSDNEDEYDDDHYEEYSRSDRFNNDDSDYEEDDN
jgi:hypothetical protein